MDEAWTSATKTSELETVAISQPSAIVCISQPRLESWDARKMERKVGSFSGASKPGDAFCSVEFMMINLCATRSLSPSSQLGSDSEWRAQGMRAWLS